MAHRDILHRVTNPVVAEVGMQRLLQNTTFVTRSRNRPLLVLAGMEFRSLPGDHGVPPRTNAASPGVIAAHHLERGTASFGRRRQAHELKVPFGRSPRKRHRGNGGQTGEFSKTRLLIARRICAARHKFALPSGRRLCFLWLRDLSLIISAPAPWSAREGALPRR